MPDGEMRRPPQLWEQRLARTTSILGVGVTSGDASAIVEPAPAPGVSTGFDASPVLPPVGDFIDPSTPTLIGGVQGINVLWDGLNSAGDLWPYDTSFVEVHMDTSSGTFTPGTATLKGRLARPGSLFVGGLTAGTTYYFRLRGADPAGNVTTASTAGSALPGEAQAADIAAGAVTADKLTAGTITGFYISGGFISGGTVEGARFQTSAGGSRIRIDDDVIGPFGTADAIEFVNNGTSEGLISYVGASDSLDFYADKFIFVKRNGTTGVNAVIDGEVVVSDITASGTILMGLSNGDRAFQVAGDGTIYSNGIDDNTTANAANVRVGASAQLLKSTSTVRLKDDLAPLDDNLTGVPAEKLSADPPSVDPYDVLTLTPTEFRSLSPADGSARSLGFIAEDVAAKFPWAANWDEDGLPSAIEDRPIIAALVAVIKDLTARIEALEA